MAEFVDFGQTGGQQLGQMLGGTIKESLNQRIQRDLTDKQNQRSLDALKPFLKQRGIDDNTINEIYASKPPADLIQKELAQYDKLIADQNKLAQKKGGTLADPAKDQEIFNEISDLIKKGNVGPRHPGRWGPKSREERAYLNELSSHFEERLLAKKNKGNLSDRRFKYLMSLLVKPTDTHAKMKGKLRGLAKEFDLDLGDLFGENKTKQEVKGTEEKKTGKYGLPKANGASQKDLKIGHKFESMPKASEVPAGAVLTDDKTGQKYRSDGKNWKKLGS